MIKPCEKHPLCTEYCEAEYRSMSMSKYEPLWGWVGKQPAKNLTLTFAEILLRATITVKLDITGEISLWKSIEVIMDAVGLR